MDLLSGSLVSFLVALSFACGLNLYATIAALGLLARFNVTALPSGLELMANPVVIGAAVLLFCVEFFADKIPAFDLVWNAVHTFIRIPAAALIAFRASQHLSPGMQLLVTMIAASVAGVAHGSKTAARAAITASPEPFSNIALSSAEDAGAVALTWVATHHPVAAGAAAGVAVLVALVLARYLVRAVSRQFVRVRGAFRSGPITQ